MNTDTPLRARKKLRTRELLVETALRLFAQAGFEAVTVADIARAAEVSEQTVYNYFPAKEALVLDEDEAYIEIFAAMVRDRPPGVTLVEAATRQALDLLQGMIERPVSPYYRGGMPFLVVNSTNVRRAWLMACERHANAVAQAMVAQSGGRLSMVAATITAAGLLAPFRVIVDEAGIAMTEGNDVAARMRALRPQIKDGMRRLARGLEDL